MQGGTGKEAEHTAVLNSDRAFPGRPPITAGAGTVRGRLGLVPPGHGAARCGDALQGQHAGGGLRAAQGQRALRAPHLAAKAGGNCFLFCRSLFSAV